MAIAFRPKADATVSIDVSSTTDSEPLGDGPESVRVMNNGTATAWINFGGSTVTATVDNDIPVGPGVTEVFTFPVTNGAPLYVAAIAAGSTGKIYFTPGSGI